MRSRISAAKSSGSVTIIVQDFSRSPVSRFFTRPKVRPPSAAVNHRGP
jgi:hypothetical protein